MNYDICFSRAELETIKNIGEFNDYLSLSKILPKSRSQTYRVVKSLKEKGVLSVDQSIFLSNPIEMKKIIVQSNIPYIKQLIVVLKKYPNLIGIFRKSGIPILLELLEPKTIKEIKEKTSSDEQTIYKIIRKAREISLIRKNTENKYELNAESWPEAEEFFKLLKKQEISFDKRVPVDSTIYYKSRADILFSNSRTIADATLTAFSVFDKYGIEVKTNTNYYYLPVKKLTKQEIFNHALLITKVEKNIRNLIFIAIFFKKNNIRSDAEIVTNLKKVISGLTVEGYPSKQELIEKAKMYGVDIE